MALAEIGARLRLAGATGFKKDANNAADSLGKMAKKAGEADRKVTGLERAAKRSGGALGKLGKAAAFGLGGLAAGAGAGLVVVLGDSINKAGDLAETMSKVNNVFGKSATDIRVWSKTAARSFGLSQQEALAAAGQYGDMFKQLGFTEKAAVANSKALVKMSADLGSFHNVDPTDVLDRIGAAMRGEYDSLQALIPNINAARVETQALAMTGKAAAKALTAQEKVAATLAIITKDGANANNDFAETSGGLANQQRILKAQLDDTKTAIGNGLLPIMTDLATWANDEAVPAVQRFVDQFQRGVGPGGEFRDALGGVRDAARDAWPHIKTGFEWTKKLVGFVIEHKDAFVAITAGVLAYRTAMKSAVMWTQLMATLDMVGLGNKMETSGSKAAKGASGWGKLGKALGVAGLAYGLFDAAKNGIQGLDAEGNPVERLQITSDKDKKQGTPKPIGEPRYGDEARKPRVMTPNLRPRSSPAPTASIPSQPVAAGSSRQLVVPVVINGREVGRAVLDDFEDRVARR